MQVQVVGSSSNVDRLARKIFGLLCFTALRQHRRAGPAPADLRGQIPGSSGLLRNLAEALGLLVPLLQVDRLRQARSDRRKVSRLADRLEELKAFAEHSLGRLGVTGQKLDLPLEDRRRSVVQLLAEVLVDRPAGRDLPTCILESALQCVREGDARSTGRLEEQTAAAVGQDLLALPPALIGGQRTPHLGGCPPEEAVGLLARGAAAAGVAERLLGAFAHFGNLTME